MRINPAIVVTALLYSSVIIFLSLTFSSILFGEPKKLTRGFDPDGMACGVDFGLTEYPYIYFSNPTAAALKQSVCVKTCPDLGKKPQLPKELECAPNSVVKECKGKISIDNPQSQFLIYDSFHYKGNICIPRNLAYYEAIKELAAPPGRLTNTHDVYQAKWLLLVFVGVASLFSYLLLGQLKANTQLCVWGLILGLFFLVGSLGIYFASEARDAFRHAKSTNSITAFQVDEEYILKMTNVPSPGTFLVLSFIFILLFFYGAYFLYNNSDRIKDLAELFEMVEVFMNGHNYLIQFAYPLIGFFSFFLMLTLITILYILCNYDSALRSCFSVDFDQIGPFEKIQGGVLYYLQYVVVFFFLWGVQIVFGFNNYITSSSLIQWMTVGFVTNEQQNQYYNHGNSSMLLTRYFWSESLYSLSKIAHAGLILLVSPVKFVCDAFRDWALSQKNEKFRAFLTKFCCWPFIQIYEQIRAVEDIIFVELAINRRTQISIGVCLTLVETNLDLKNEEESTTVETYERLRNIVDSFLLITKILTGLICAVSCKLLISIKYFSSEMYEGNLTCFVAALIGYYIASIYFQIYSIVAEGMGYVYLRTRQIEKRQQEAQRQGGQSTFSMLEGRFKKLAEIIQKLEQKIRVQGQDQGLPQ